jgi:hypothetical protein
MELLKLDQYYPIQIQSGISQTGQNRIIHYVYDLLIMKGAKVCCQDCLREKRFSDWKFAKSIAKGEDDSGTYGKITRRISKMVHDSYDIDLTESEIATIGNIADQYSYQKNDYQIDFTTKFSWRSGDFGDEGSCFWSGRKLARTMLEEHGAWAMRLWQNERGMGRCWLIPPLTSLELDAYVVFNGYSAAKNNGTHNNLETRNYADILSVLLAESNTDVRVQEINLYNNRYNTGLLYINSGNAYAVGSNLSSYTETYDLRWPDACYTCTKCSNIIYWSDSSESVRMVGDRILCRSCYNESYVKCASCRNEYHKTDLIVITSTNFDDFHICAECNRVYTYCYNCNHRELRGAVVIKGEHTYCSYCARNYIKSCGICAAEIMLSRNARGYKQYTMYTAAPYSTKEIMLDTKTMYICASHAYPASLSPCYICGVMSNYILPDGRCPSHTRYHSWLRRNWLKDGRTLTES